MAKDNYVITGKDRSKEAFDIVQKNMKSLRGAFGLLAGAATAVAGAAGLAAVVKSGLETGSTLKDTADRLGFTVKGLQQLQFAGVQTGVKITEFNDSMQRMVRRIGAATEGAGPAAKALIKLGLSAEDLARMDPDQAFIEIAEGISQLKTKSEQTQVAFTIFDIAGSKLVNTMALGRAGIEAMTIEAGELGLALSEVDAAAIGDATATVDKAKAVFEGLSITLSARVAPSITAVTNLMIEMGKAGEGGLGAIIPSAEQIVKAVGFVGDTIQGAAITLKFLEGAFKATFALITDLVRRSVQGWIDLFNLIPGIDIEPPAFLTALADTSREEVQKVRREFDALTSTTFSAGLELEFNKVTAAAEATAKAVAEARAGLTTDAPAPEAEEGAEEKKAREAEVRKRQRMAQSLARLQESFLLEEEQIALKFAKEEELLRLSLDNRLIRQREFEVAIAAVRKKSETEQAVARKARLKKENAEDDKFRKQAIDGFWALADQGAKSNKALFTAVKAVRIAQAIVSTWTAATNALAEVPYPANIAVAAGIVAGGLANVATIAGTSPGGGGGGGGGSGGGLGSSPTGGRPGTSALEEPTTPQLGAAAAAPEEFRPKQEITINLTGDADGRIPVEAVRNLIGMINEQVEDGVDLKVGLGGEG